MTGIDRGTRIIAYLVLALGLAVTLLPITLMLVNAFKTSIDILANPIALPRDAHVANFVNAWHDAHLGQAMLNSAIVSARALPRPCSPPANAA